MSTRSLQSQCLHFLSDMESVEQQALAQLVAAPKAAGDRRFADMLAEHHEETRLQAELVRARLEAAGASRSGFKDAIMKLGGKSFLAFAKLQPETPGRLAVHVYAYEAMEWAGYQLLSAFAQYAGDHATDEVARTIAPQERAMMARLESAFDGAERASHPNEPPGKEEMRKHLAEAHALESQSAELMKKASEIAGDDRLAGMYRTHLEETREHAGRLEKRLRELGGSTSTFKDAMLAFGAMEWGLFFQSQSDRAAKVAAFAFACEHLEIGAYEMLRRAALHAGDADTANLAESILEQERAMADRIAARFDDAVRASLVAVAGVVPAARVELPVPASPSPIA